jgi:uncharacterized membrane protein
MLAVMVPFTIASWACLMLTSFALAARGRRLEPGERGIPKDEMRRHRQWLFYCNPDDPRGWVPKWSGPGGTVNVRTRGGAAVMLVFTSATILGVMGTLIAMIRVVA